MLTFLSLTHPILIFKILLKFDSIELSKLMNIEHIILIFTFDICLLINNKYAIKQSVGNVSPWGWKSRPETHNPTVVSIRPACFAKMLCQPQTQPRRDPHHYLVKNKLKKTIDRSRQP